MAVTSPRKEIALPFPQSLIKWGVDGMEGVIKTGILNWYDTDGAQQSGSSCKRLKDLAYTVSRTVSMLRLKLQSSSIISPGNKMPQSVKDFLSLSWKHVRDLTTIQSLNLTRQNNFQFCLCSITVTLEPDQGHPNWHKQVTVNLIKIPQTSINRSQSHKVREIFHQDCLTSPCCEQTQNKTLTD